MSRFYYYLGILSLKCKKLIFFQTQICFLINSNANFNIFWTSRTMQASCKFYINILYLLIVSGSRPEHGVPDMTMLSDIDEEGINRNLHVRYDRDQIYVSFSNKRIYLSPRRAPN